MEVVQDQRITEAGARAARLTLFLYVAAIIGAEATSVRFSGEITLACYAVSLFAIVNHLVLVPSMLPEVRAALACLAVVPLAKIGAFSLPQHFVPVAYWELFPGALALTAVFALRAIGGTTADRFLPWRARSRRGWGAQILIAATGPPLGVAAAYTLWSLDSATGKPGLETSPAEVIVVAAFSGLALEVVFRGVVQTSLAQFFGWYGVVLASLLYAGLFLGTSSSFLLLLALATSLVWGALAAATRTVTGVAASHALYAMTWVVLY